MRDGGAYDQAHGRHNLKGRNCAMFMPTWECDKMSQRTWRRGRLAVESAICIAVAVLKMAKWIVFLLDLFLLTNNPLCRI